jgi:hypothetical protein
LVDGVGEVVRDAAVADDGAAVAACAGVGDGGGWITAGEDPPHAARATTQDVMTIAWEGRKKDS